MSRVKGFIAILVLSLCSVGQSAILITDPGSPDRALIGSDAIRAGGQAVIPISIICDEDVACIQMPISYDNAVLQYDTCIFFGVVLEWDDISLQERPSGDIVTIIGWADLGGLDNPYLNTGGTQAVIAELHFSALPTAPLGTYPLAVAIDPYVGQLMFFDSLGAGWRPSSQNGMVQIVNEEGFADSVAVGYDTVNSGQEATVPITIQNDEDVAYVNIPISYDESALNLIGWEFFGDISDWDEIEIINITGSGILTIEGRADTGGALNPYLNTGGLPEAAIALHFSTNPNAQTGIYPLNITVDSISGPLVFKNPDNISWVPASKNGHIRIVHPVCCDLEYSYLWGYGQCRTPSTHRQYACRVRNTGSGTAEQVCLRIIHPSVFIYDGSSPLATVADNEMTWNLGNIGPGGAMTVYWWVNIPAGLGGDTVVTTSEVTATSCETDLQDNQRQFVEIVGFSSDPNDKTTDPPGYGPAHFIKNDQPLDYTIFFENDSLATLSADTILVYDTLSSNLDWSTLEFGPMSHPDPCTAWFNQQAGVVICRCDSIALEPNDSTHRGEGFISFSIKPRWDLNTGDVVPNRAQIKFDENDWIAAPHLAPVFNTMDITAPVSKIESLPDSIYEAT